jgi:FkbM family methyltransferase
MNWRRFRPIKRFAERLLGSLPALWLTAKLGHRWPKTRVVRSLCWHAGAGAWHPERHVTAQIQHGFELVIDLTDHTFRHLYFHGEYQPAVTRIIEQVAQRGQIWIDVGANVGYFSILLSKLVGDSGAVIAFEPNPVTRNFLELSVKRNKRKNVTVYSCALGADTALAALHVPREPRSIVGGHGRPSLIRHADIKETVEVPVEIQSLDSIVHETKIWGIKMDVEGYETEVLKGAQNLFTRNPPAVVLSEVAPGLTTPAELGRSILGFGYKAFDVEGLEEWNPLSPIDNSSAKDFIFIHRSAEKTLLPRVFARSS